MSLIVLRAGRPHDRRRLRLQPISQLLGAPAIALSRRDDLGLDRRRRLVRTGPRRRAVRRQAGLALGLFALPTSDSPSGD